MLQIIKKSSTKTGGVTIIKAGSKDAPTLPEAPESERVGYKNPPRHSRFKPGQSGNPLGRPRSLRKPPSTAQDYRVKLLTQMVTVTIEGRPTKMPIVEAMLMKQIDQALRGNRLAIQDLLRPLDNQELPVRQKRNKEEKSPEELMENFLRSLEANGAQRQRE